MYLKISRELMNAEGNTLNLKVVPRSCAVMPVTKPLKLTFEEYGDTEA